VLVCNVFGVEKISLTKDQVRILKLAYIEGSKVGFPETLQAIVWQETKAGNYNANRYGIVGDSHLGSVGKRSYGPAQVRLETAWDVLKEYPELGSFKNDENLLVALLTDDHFNISIAAHYLKMQLGRFNSNWKKSILAYNVGPSNVKRYGLARDPNKYVDRVKSHIVNIARPFSRGDYLVR
jgi:hypothetical protein